MIDLNPIAIAVSVFAAFVISSIYYAVLGKQLAALNPAYADPARPPAWKLAVELVRSLFVTLVIAGLASLLEVAEVSEAVLLGVALWVGFPAVLLAGSVIWERVSAKLAAIHAGDWLIKLLLISIIVGVWR